MVCISISIPFVRFLTLFCVQSLDRLDENCKFYKHLTHLFYCKWLHPGTSAKIKSIYIKKNCKDPRHHIRFHGTQRACYEGSSGDKWKPCSNNSCYTCSILRNGFSISKSDPSSMFGPAIYSTIVSSKANLYAKNHNIASRKHAIIVCGVFLGRCACVSRPGDYSAFDTVEATTTSQGGSVNYPETVSYRQRNVVPLGVIIYTRKGWTP
ncbi:hypothetical protein H634G_10464 [Metarhizium anisopliae BRIP 53293]|uniref:Uncharacterized protein n=1 Tax=Metarhizium anisopliae BRIP 53293 TaxID=1291518 RepID=A0A0D9NKN3_METAN|nr:hypothetical protein H634G_10464 [Metarhizium anisopliae BRIP 53293]KJK91822.1 hypothetical protein H633G_04293 [Metarhizium anisopliae BRIP 53284]